MRTVHLSIADKAEVSRRFVRAMSGEPQGCHLSFASVDLLWRVLSPDRWTILRAMTGQGPLAPQEIARRVGRDVDAVHGDLQALFVAGVVQREDDSRFVFPYDAVHVDFTITAAA